MTSESVVYLLEEKLFFESSSPSTGDLMQMAQKGGSLNFLYDEPDLYTLEDGEPIYSKSLWCIYNSRT